MTARALNAEGIAANPIEANPIFSTVIGDEQGYPQILDTALVWLSSDSIVKSGLDFASWSNKGTGGAVYDLTVVAGLPTIGLINGNEGVHFGQTASVRPALPSAINRPITIMFIMQIDSIVAGGTLNTLFDNHNSGTVTPRMQFFHRRTQGIFQNWHAVYPNGMATAIDSSDVLPHGVSVNDDPLSGGMILDVSGNPIDINTGAGGTGLVYITMGNEYVNLDRGFIGTVTDFIIWDSELTTVDYNEMKAYLAAKGGFTWAIN